MKKESNKICKCGHTELKHTWWALNGSPHTLNCKTCKCKRF